MAFLFSSLGLVSHLLLLVVLTSRLVSTSAVCGYEPLSKAEASALTSSSLPAREILHRGVTAVGQRTKQTLTTTCLITGLLRDVAPGHLAAIKGSYVSFFSSLRGASPPGPKSAYWQSVPDVRTLAKGDLIAFDAPPSSGFDEDDNDSGGLAIATGPPAIVTQTSGGCTGVSSLNPDGSMIVGNGGNVVYSKYALEVLDASPVPHANDTRKTATNSAKGMIGRGTIYIYTEPSSGAPVGFQLKPNGKVYTSPQYTITAARMLQPSASMASNTMPLQSAALCDALGNGQPMLVATSHLSSSYLAANSPAVPSLMVFRGDVGFPAKEISLPAYQDSNVNVACGDIFPGGASEAVIVPGDGPMGATAASPGKLQIVNLLSGSLLFETTLPFDGPASVAVGDFDNDGYQDVAFAAATDISISSPLSSDAVYIAFSTGAARPTTLGAFFTVERFDTNLGSMSGLSLSASTLSGDNSAKLSKSLLVVTPAGNHTASPVVQIWERADGTVTPPSPTANAWGTPRTVNLPLSAFAEGGRAVAISSSYVRGWILAVSIPTMNSNSSAVVIDMKATTLAAVSLTGGLPWGLDAGMIWNGSKIAPGTPPLLVSGGALFPPPNSSSTSLSNPGTLAPAFMVSYRGMSSLFFRGVTTGTQSPSFKELMPILSPTSAHFLAGLQSPNSTTYPWSNLASNSPGALHAASMTDPSQGSVYLSKAGLWLSYPSDSPASPPHWSQLATSVVVPRINYQRPYSGNFSFSESQRSAYAWGYDPKLASSVAFASWYLSAQNSAANGYSGPALKTSYTKPSFSGSASGAQYLRERLIATALNFTVAPSMKTAFAGSCNAGTSVGLPPNQVISYQNHKIPLWSPDNRVSGYFYHADARHTSGIDSANFVALIHAVALGLNMPTTVAGLASATTATVNTGVSTTTTIYPTNVARKPVNYTRLVGMLKPGDLIFIDSGATGGLAYAKKNKLSLSAHQHVAVWLGYTVSGGPHPLVIDSAGSLPPQMDANGFAIPPGPNVRPFSPDSWYYKSFSHATRWIHDEQDGQTHFGAVSSTFRESSTGYLTAASLVEPSNVWRGFGTSPSDGVLSPSPLYSPITFDPRATFCYSGPVLNQGMCGSCWANSGAEIMAITLCLAMQNTFGIEQFSQISSQYAMAIGKNVAPVLSGYQESQPCLGGVTVESIFIPFVNWAQQQALTKNTTIPVLTMDVTETLLSGSAATNIGANLGATIPVPGLTGCVPYQEINCGSTSGVDVNSAWINQNPQLCPNNYPTTACQNPSPAGTSYTPDAITASNSLAYFTSSADFIPNLSSGVQVFYTGTGSWAPSDITTVKSYLVNNGPVSVAMSACGSFQAWFQGCIGMTAFYDGQINQCVSTSSLTGYTFNSQVGAYVAPVNFSLITMPFNGPSCPAGQAGHAVTIVGWTSIGGVDTWIIRNSWGSNWGDGGHFYIPTQAGGCSTCTSGSVALSIPGYISFTPRNNYPLNPLPSTSLASAFVAIPGSNGTTPIPSKYLGNGTLVGGFFPVTSPSQIAAVGSELVQAISAAAGSQSSYALASMPPSVMEQVVQQGYIYQIVNASVYNLLSGNVESHTSTLFVPYGNQPIPVISSDSYIIAGTFTPNGTVGGALGNNSSSIFSNPTARDAAIGVGVLLIILILCCVSFCIYRKRQFNGLLATKADVDKMSGIAKLGGATGGNAFVDSVARYSPQPSPMGMFSPGMTNARLQYGASPIGGGGKLATFGSDINISNNALRTAASFKPANFGAQNSSHRGVGDQSPSPLVFQSNPMGHPIRLSPQEKVKQEARKRAARGSAVVKSGTSTPIPDATAPAASPDRAVERAAAVISQASESVFAREQRAKLNLAAEMSQTAPATTTEEV